MDKYDKLSFEELESYIEEILSGYKISRIKNSFGKEIVYVFKHSSLDNRKRSQVVYDDFFNEAKDLGLSTIAEMEDIIKHRGIFTEEDEEAIRKLEGKIEAQEQVLRKTFRVSAHRERLKNIITNLHKEVRKIYSKKDKMMQLTCEAKAVERRSLYLLVNCVMDFETEKPIWDSVNAFEDSNIDEILRFNLVSQFLSFIGGVLVPVVRQIARSSQWRLRYVISKKLNIDLFGKAVRDFSVDQLNLMQWSDYYASIYEMLPDDRPPDSIIEDDMALDAYMEEYFREKNREDTARRGSGNKKFGKVKSAYEHDEVIVTKANPLYKDIEYSKVPKKTKSSESTDVTERQVQERDKYSKRRKGSQPSAEEIRKS